MIYRFIFIFAFSILPLLGMESESSEEYKLIIPKPLSANPLKTDTFYAKYNGPLFNQGYINKIALIKFACKNHNIAPATSVLWNTRADMPTKLLKELDPLYKKHRNDLLQGSKYLHKDLVAQITNPSKTKNPEQVSILQILPEDSQGVIAKNLFTAYKQIHIPGNNIKDILQVNKNLVAIDKTGLLTIYNKKNKRIFSAELTGSSRFFALLPVRGESKDIVVVGVNNMSLINPIKRKVTYSLEGNFDPTIAVSNGKNLVATSKIPFSPQIRLDTITDDNTITHHSIVNFFYPWSRVSGLNFLDENRLLATGNENYTKGYIIEINKNHITETVLGEKVIEPLQKNNDTLAVQGKKIVALEVNPDNTITTTYVGTGKGSITHITSLANGSRVTANKVSATKSTVAITTVDNQTWKAKLPRVNNIKTDDALNKIFVAHKKGITIFEPEKTYDLPSTTKKYLQDNKD